MQEPLDDSIFSQFQEKPFFSGLSLDDIKAFFSFGHLISIRRGDYLIHEGDKPEEVFFVVKGSLEAFRKDVSSEESHSIATFGPGDIIGEVSLIDKGPRSAHVIALSDAQLISIPFSAWDIEKNSSPFIYKLFIRIAQNLSSRLRNSNKLGLEQQVERYKERLVMSQLFITLLSTLSGYAFILKGLETFNLQYYSIYFTLPITLGAFTLFIHIIRKLQVPASTFGITLLNWRRSMFEGIVFTIPLLVLIALYKWAVVTLGWIHRESMYVLNVTVRDLTIYPFIVVPLQELIARGGLQGLLSRFISTKRKTATTIIISSVLFSTMHLVFSFYFACITFFMSLYLGWLYSRNPNLIGVWFAHCMIGLWGLDVIGL